MATNKAAEKLYKLFIANLPWTVSGSELKQYFSQFGHVADAKVIFDRSTGMSKRYGFINITDLCTYESINNKGIHVLEGNTLVIKFNSS